MGGPERGGVDCEDWGWVVSPVDYLCALWLDAKRAEQEATERRRAIEDELLAAGDVRSAGSYKLTITQRMNTRIDADALQEIAIENGLHDHLSTLFRWKPELNKKAWDATDEAITRPLMDAITTTPGRPSFSIKLNEAN